jgi:hypothetical protein
MADVCLPVRLRRKPKRNSKTHKPVRIGPPSRHTFVDLYLQQFLVDGSSALSDRFYCSSLIDGLPLAYARQHVSSAELPSRGEIAIMSTRWIRTGLIALVCATLWTSGNSLEAQVQTGSVVGSVKDDSNGVLPGVTVTLAPSAAKSTPVTVVTDEVGYYRFPAVGPGTYKLTVMLEGFATYLETDLQVAVAATIERDVTLKPSQLAETITVSGRAPVVDVAKVAVTANIPAVLVEAIPAIHSGLNDLQKWAPGTAPSAPGDENQYMSVMGSPGFETSWMIEGAMTASPSSGDIFTAGDPDTLQELQTTVLGASAEYQIAQGGVMNAVLKSGTNLLKFDFEGTKAPDALTSSPIMLACNTCSGGVQSGFANAQSYTFGAHAGGPVARDRVWFYGGYGTWKQVQAQPGTNPATLAGSHRIWITTKTTARLTPSSNFTGFYYDSPYQLGGVPTASTLYAATAISPGHSHVYAVELTKTVSATTFFVARGSGWWESDQRNALSGDNATAPHTDLVTGIASQGVSSIASNGSGRHALALKLDKFVHMGKVDHDLRGGVQYEYNYYDSLSAVPSGVTYQDANGTPSQASYAGPSVLGARYTQRGGWVEDQLTAGRLTINAGLRFDSLHASSPDEPVINTLLDRTGGSVAGLGNLFTWNTWSPRVGLNVKLRSDGRTLLRGTYGRYYRTILLSDFSSLHPGNATVTLDKWNPATLSYSTLVSVTNPNSNLTIDRNIKAPYTDQYSIGIDHELMPNVAVTASYVHKYTGLSVGWSDIGGVYGTKDVILANGQELTVLPLLSAASSRLFERTNGPGYFVRYDGLILSLNKRLSQRWQADVQYTWSRSYGLQTGSISATSNPTGQDPNDLINYTGRLIPQDRPQMVRAEASYLVPKVDVNLATAIEDISGNALAPTALVSLPQGQRSIAIAPPGTYRTPRVHLVNLQLDKTLFKKGDHKLVVTAQVFNLFQNEAYETVATTNFFSANFLQPSTWLPARYLKIGGKYTF